MFPVREEKVEPNASGNAMLRPRTPTGAEGGEAELPDNDDLISVDEAKDLIWNVTENRLGVSVQRVCDLCRKDRIPGSRKLRKGRRGPGVPWLVSREGIEIFNAEKRPRGRPPGIPQLPKAS